MGSAKSEGHACFASFGPSAFIRHLGVCCVCSFAVLKIVSKLTSGTSPRRSLLIYRSHKQQKERLGIATEGKHFALEHYDGAELKLVPKTEETPQMLSSLREADAGVTAAAAKLSLQDEDDANDQAHGIGDRQGSRYEQQLPSPPDGLPESSPEPFNPDAELPQEYFSYCKCGTVEMLAAKWDYYKKFIGCTDSDGSNGIILATRYHRSRQTIGWLHERGEPIDKANQAGRTPLLEAAL